MLALLNKKWLLIAGIGVSLAALLAFITSSYAPASLEQARAYLRGDEIAVIPQTIDLGRCAANSTSEPQLQILNLTSSPVTVTGIATSCSCVLADSLPVSIPAYARHTIRLTIHVPEQLGEFAREAVIYTSSTKSPQFPIAITGKTLPVDRAVAAVTSPDETDEHVQPATQLPDSTTTREPDLALPLDSVATKPMP